MLIGRVAALGPVYCYPIIHRLQQLSNVALEIRQGFLYLRRFTGWKSGAGPRPAWNGRDDRRQTGDLLPFPSASNRLPICVRPFDSRLWVSLGRDISRGSYRSTGSTFSHLLYGVRPADPLTFVAATLCSHSRSDLCLLRSG